jgi:lipoprotein-releasing system permease protein
VKIILFLLKKIIADKSSNAAFSVVSLISITGIALGVAVLIISLTILDGFERIIEEKVTNLNSHIIVSGFGGRDLPLESNFDDILYDAADTNLSSFSPFLSRFVLISKENKTEGATLTGIQEENNLNLHKLVIDGSVDFQNGNLILGKIIADNLNVNVGDSIIVIYSNQPDKVSFLNPPQIYKQKVEGIFESGMAQYDEVFIYTDLSFVQNLINDKHSISGFNIRLNSLDNIEEIVSQLQQKLSYPYYARSIFTEHKNIFTWIELQKKPIPIVLGLITLVAVFNIIGTLLMIILERTKFIGIIRSLGGKRRDLILLFTLNGVYLSSIGIILGNLLALILSLIQLHFDLITLPSTIYFISKVPIIIDPLNYLIVSLTAFAAAVTASFIPSFIASRFNIINAVRFE